MKQITLEDAMLLATKGLFLTVRNGQVISTF